jgi:acyl-CoA synthetase (AMP-forming)/AMP-acid ligase II
MLLNRWENVNTRRGGEVAFRHSERPAGVSFREIDQMAGEVDVSGEVVPAIGESLDFFPSLIAAWRAGKPALLVENQTSRIRPIRCGIPAGTVLIKQTCGASGIERSLFFGESQVMAEGQRNIQGLGLHEGRRGLAAISLAHSYGFGCLALPLLLAGIPLEIVSGPLPMFLQAALERGGEIFLPGVPAIWKTWWQTGVTACPAISLALCAGSPLSLELETAVHAECGLKIHNFYGTSETGAIAFDDSRELRKRADFVGKILQGIEAVIDGTGRLAVASDACAVGADSPAWEDEFGGRFYNTLDMGDVSDGGVFITQCIGRAINVAGRKVSPIRLQNILEELDGVAVAVVERGQSRDFERFGEIRVRLTVKPGYAPKVIREQLRQRVESWEMPRHWEFVSSEGDLTSRLA